jgi:hypothetical protein
MILNDVTLLVLSVNRQGDRQDVSQALRMEPLMPSGVPDLEDLAREVRNGDEITSSTMHHSFRPPLPDLKSQKYQNSLLFLQLL